MKLKIFIITFLFLVPRFIKAQSLSEKLFGIWQINEGSDKRCLVFINSRSGAVTAADGLVHYYFTYTIADGNQPVLLNERIPIYGNKEDHDQLIELKNDSILLVNSKTKGKNALLMKGKQVNIYKKLLDVDVETFLRKPGQANLIGTWYNIFKNDTTAALTFKSNNAMTIKYIKSNKEAFGSYIADFSKQPMTIDFINEKGDNLPNIFVFISSSKLHLAGPKNGKRRAYFTFFGDNIMFIKEKL